MSDSEKLNKAVQLIAQLSIDRASQVFSKFLKTGAQIDMDDAYYADIADITSKIIIQYDEIVGAMIDLVGDAPFKFLFFVTREDSFILSDLILRKEIGTTTEFDLYAKSAVQEIGNILASAITNVFTKDFDIELIPDPPFVLNDFAGTIFEEFVRETAEERNGILFIETKFKIVRADIHCHMFVLPVGNSDQVLNELTM